MVYRESAAIVSRSSRSSDTVLAVRSPQLGKETTSLQWIPADLREGETERRKEKQKGREKGERP